MVVSTSQARIRSSTQSRTRRESGRESPGAAAQPGARRAGPKRRLRKVAAMMGVFHKFRSSRPDPVLRQRQLVADLCRLVGAQLGQPNGRAARSAGGESPGTTMNDLGLSARMRQTLQGLLAGESEKQIAFRLELSPHTVHVYVKGLYRHFGVSSRGELLAYFVRPGAGTN